MMEHAARQSRMAKFKHQIGVLFLAIVLAVGSQALAQSYDPSSVILLKKRDETKLKTPEQALQEQEKAKKGNNITVAPKTGALVVNPNLGAQAKAPDDKVQQMNAAYASHLYSGICADDYRMRIAPKTEKNLNNQQMWADIQASCKCLSSEILKQVPPEALSDYVMFTYGHQDSKKADPQVDAFYKTPQKDAIVNIASNPAIQTKCGFLK
jgi:hypothetical protein